MVRRMASARGESSGFFPFPPGREGGGPAAVATVVVVTGSAPAVWERVA